MIQHPCDVFHHVIDAHQEQILGAADFDAVINVDEIIAQLLHGIVLFFTQVFQLA